MTLDRRAAIGGHNSPLPSGSEQGCPVDQSRGGHQDGSWQKTCLGGVVHPNLRSGHKCERNHGACIPREGDAAWKDSNCQVLNVDRRAHQGLR